MTNLFSDRGCGRSFGGSSPWFCRCHTQVPTHTSKIMGQLARVVRAFGSVRGVSWSEVATVPKRKSHRGLDLDLSWNSEEDIWKGRKESNGTK